MLSDLRFILYLKERYAIDSSLEGYGIDEVYLSSERYDIFL